MAAVKTSVQGKTRKPERFFRRRPCSVSGPDSDSSKKCVVTGAMLPRERMIRFVLGPNNVVIPDIASKLPGRGFWVSADHQAIKQAAEGKAFRKAARTDAKVNADMPHTVVLLLTKRCLELLSLAKSAGITFPGLNQVEQAIKRGNLSYIIKASDAGEDGSKKIDQSGKDIIPGPESAVMGRALGEDKLAFIGLKSHPLSDKIKTEFARWQYAGYGAINLPHI